MGLFSSISKFFGYDRKAHNRNIEAFMWARDAAYKDASAIERASNMMLGQIPHLQAQAGYLHSQAGMLDRAAGRFDQAGKFLMAQAGEVRLAGDQALKIGQLNAKNILTETGEWARRRGSAQASEQSFNLALAAASGIRLDTGGSSDIFRNEVKAEHGRELAHGKRAGQSQATIAREEGELAKQEAYAAATGIQSQAQSAFAQASSVRGQAQGVRGMASGVLAAIPGIQSSAARFNVQASQLRTASDLAYFGAKDAKSRSKASLFTNILQTGLAIGGLGVAGGWIGAGASGGAGVTAAKTATWAKWLAGGTAAVAGASALASILGSKDSGKINPGDLYTPAKTPDGKVSVPNAQIQIPGMPAINMPAPGQTLDYGQMPIAKQFNAPTSLANTFQKRTTESLRQFAASGNVIGTGQYNPLAGTS